MEICLKVLSKGMLQVGFLQMVLQHCVLWSGVWSGCEGGVKAVHKLVGEFGDWLPNCVWAG